MIGAELARREFIAELPDLEAHLPAREVSALPLAVELGAEAPEDAS